MSFRHIFGEYESFDTYLERKEKTFDKKRYNIPDNVDCKDIFHDKSECYDFYLMECADYFYSHPEELADLKEKIIKSLKIPVWTYFKDWLNRQDKNN